LLAVQDTDDVNGIVADAIDDEMLAKSGNAPDRHIREPRVQHGKPLPQPNLIAK
jgi:hypothetical protein